MLFVNQNPNSVSVSLKDYNALYADISTLFYHLMYLGLNGHLGFVLFKGQSCFFLTESRTKE